MAASGTRDGGKAPKAAPAAKAATVKTTAPSVKAAAPVAAAKAPAIRAEPIAPETVQAFPHLAPYVGHVLLGDAALQIVLAGVPPRVPSDAWQPAVLAVFQKHRGVWRRSEALRALELARRTTRGAASFYYPVAVDLGTDTDQSHAFATFIYEMTGPGESAERALVTWQLDAQLGRLAVVFDAYAPTGGKSHNDAATASLWQVRLRGARTTAFVQGATGLGSRTHLANYLLLDGGDESAGFVAYRPFTVALGEEPGAARLTPTTRLKGFGRPPVEGFELLLDETAAAHTLARVAEVADCLFGTARPRTDVKDEAKLSWILGCDETPEPLGVLRLKLAAADQGRERQAFPVYVFGADGRLVQHAAVASGVPLDLALPPGGPYQLADTRLGRQIPGTGTIHLKAGETREVTLPKRGVGFLRLQGMGTRLPAELVVKRLDQGDDDGDGGGHAPWVVSPNGAVQRLSPGALLASSWPVDLRLLEGTYRIDVRRGRKDVECQLQVVIEPGRHETLACGKGADARQHDGAALTDTASQSDVASKGDATAKSDPAAKRDPAAKKANASAKADAAKAVIGTGRPEPVFRSVDLGLAARVLPAAMLAEASGVEVIAAPAVALADKADRDDAAETTGDDDDGDRMPSDGADTSVRDPAGDRSHNPAAPGKLVVTFLEARDLASDASLRFLPASTALARRWRAARGPAIQPDILPRFATFLRREGATGLLELGCPGAGQTPEEYAQLVQRLQPDAVRLIGCRAGARQDALLDLYRKIALRRQGPLILTALSPLDRVPDGPRTAQLLVATGQTAGAPPTFARLLGSLRTGAYALAAGVIPWPQALLPAAPRQGRHQGPLTLVLRGLPPAGVAPVTVLVYSDKGLLGRQLWDAHALPVGGEARIPLKHKGGVAWLQIEVRGGAGAADLLGATGYVPVQPLRAQNVGGRSD